MTPADPAFIRARTAEVVLADGTRVRLRPLTPDDGQLLIDGFARLSPESRYRRFLSPVDELTPDLLRTLLGVDYADHFAWGALALDERGEPMVGVSRYVRSRDHPETAEAAVTVIDDFQHRGLGTLLLQALAAMALEHGIRRFRGSVLEGNRAIRDLLEEAGARMTHDGAGTMIVEVDLPVGDDLAAWPASGALRALARGEVRGPLRWDTLWARRRPAGGGPA